MLKSRRGLLAAGLAVAVIGTIGVVSTLSAGAEQIPDAPPAPVAAPVDQADVVETAPADVTPPPTLPWGDKPRSIRKGRDGATSRSLKASGLSAAPSQDDDHGNRRAPKGRSSRTSFLKTQRTDVVPPEPPPTATPSAGASSAPSGRQVTFHYNVGSQAAAVEGAFANLTISKPELDKADYHTLAELAVQSDSGQIVEVGWTVDRTVNGDDDPHLFVYHWVDHKATCYNKCGFVQYSENVRPGDTLPQDTQKRFGVQYFGDAWWVAYDTEWVGYFPGEIWSDGFAKTSMVQVFGEVAASSAWPCTDMGNGRLSIDAAAAKVGSVAYLNGPTVDMYVRSSGSDVYPVEKLSNRTFRYGGPGVGDC